MSDLDKAIRDRLQVVRVHMGEHRNAQFDDGVDLPFNDAGELGAAVVSVLDLHVPIDVHDMDAGGEPPPVVERSCRGCSDEDYVQALECGERVAWGDGVDWPCATVLAIAASLGVSGEDRSEPTPAPREPVEGDAVRIWLTSNQSIVGKYFVDEHGRARVTATDTGDLSYLVNVSGVPRRVEVVSPEGTP